MNLDRDCTTDSTIYVPDGFTLNGNGFTITAVDPAGSHFTGAVVQNGGTWAEVAYLTIDTSSLSNVCDAGADRLRGIMFEGASGKIHHNTVLNINQGSSGCQEGNGIEVRNAPFDGTHPNIQSVVVSFNTVDQYQKTGILANGDVHAVVRYNNVYGFGPVSFIAQNGIQLGFGAQGAIFGNHVEGNVYSPMTWASSGILLYVPDNNIGVDANTVDANDVGIWVVGTDYAKVEGNSVTGSTWDGIAIDNQAGPVTNAFVAQNSSNGNQTGIGLYGSTVSDNVIQRNNTDYNSYSGIYAGYSAYNTTINLNNAYYNEFGIVVEGDDSELSRNRALWNNDTGMLIDGDGNNIFRNQARSNGAIDIDNIGTNVYSNNRCNTSSGPPVDCGTVPMVSVTMMARMGEESDDARATAVPFTE
jgi:parallel beta-helix repeat protein